MVQRAIELEGIDEATRQRVRIQLTLVEPAEKPAWSPAPRGFLPADVRQDILRRAAAAGTTACTAQVFSAGEERARALGVTPAFQAPRGFIPRA
ncbi:MAG: hypothetical protein M1325_01245 [Actinobacteria bacterium]|nr:hypothetical protein [Actinomycetota bacterium]